MSVIIKGFHCEFVWVDESQRIARCVHGDFEGRLLSLEVVRRCRALTGEQMPTIQPADIVETTPATGFGPGTELMLMLAQLDIAEKPGCDCKAKAEQMDRWGVEGCREHIDEIVGWMREGSHRWGWSDKFKAARLAAATGLAFKINWLDPFPGIVEEAIRRADTKRTDT